MTAQHWDVIVIGAGAAGLFCGIESARRGRRTLVLDHANKAGKKILMSGGGRCNFTNLDITPDHYLSANPHFVRSALSRYTQWDFIALVDRYAIPYHEKTLGQLFCDNSAKDIVAMLLAELEDAGGQLRLQTDILGVGDEAELFTLSTTDGDLTCASLVVASGGLSIPTMGASDFGYRLARQYGHEVRELRASLVPFTWNTQDKTPWSALSGISTPVTVTAENGQTFTLDCLITHRGLSGPAMLQISNYWQPGQSLMIDWLPGVDIAAQLAADRHQQGRKTVKGWLTQWLPQRLAEHLVEQSQVQGALADLTREQSQRLSLMINNWPFRPGGTEGYRTAEVTLAGVDTQAISSKTMMSSKRQGLYFVGEVLDVTGWLGGYNFQWAWSSGWAAGQVC